MLNRIARLSLLLAGLWLLAPGEWPPARTQAQQAPAQMPARPPAPIDFNRDIRPILADKCWVCHGPDAPSKKVTLRLDSEAGMRVALSGARHAVVPGNPGQSEMIRRINATDPGDRMPPVYSNRTLSPREIELLTAWIREGAAWQKHWSFIPPVRPALPAVKNKAWPRNPLDYFVLARLEREGLAPAPAASPAALLRRVTLDLTGLPPTPAELDAFLADKSPRAWGKVVDRLLASPRYGERMAFEWLDAARYADTNGYQIDGERFMWRWRDWVINAYNRNLPFDQFTIEQLAGDLLPAPTLDQRIATAFNRNHRLNSEDGIVAGEYYVEYIVDRVDTTSTIFLGLTMGCARCHNHKYDPLTQKEYYQLFAYFNSIPEDGRAHNYGNSAPWIAAPTSDQQTRMNTIARDLAAARARLDALTRAHADAAVKWARGLPAAEHPQWFPSDDLVVRHALDARAVVELPAAVDHIDMAKPDQKFGPKEKPDPLKTGFREGNPQYTAAPTGQGVALEGKLFFDAGNVANFNFRDRLKDYKDQFTISAWFNADNEQSGAIVTRIQETAYEKDNNLPKARGYGLFLRNGKLHFNVVGVWADDSWRVETAQPVALKQWHHVLAVFDSTQSYDRALIYLDGRRQELKINNGRLFRTFNDDKALLRIGAGGGPEYRFRGMLDEVRVYKNVPDDEAIAILSTPDSLPAIAALSAGQRTRGQQLKLSFAWLDKGAPAELRREWEQWRELRKRKTELESEFPTLMVMQEMPQPRPAFVLRRGAYDLPGEPVARALPSVLPPLPKDFPNNRLGLARWLVSRDNPLTARVQVNRLWQMLWGTGLVKTVEDFGAQGELPSHPELLDWLAVEFMNAEFGMRNGESKTAPRRWDVKALLRLIVTSATYRQSSQIIPQSAIRNPLSGDPENRLLSRGPRYRLPAEMIRDQALFAAGLLVEKQGGPSVKPYQPEGLWKDMTFSNMTEYPQDKGEGLWRRSLYTFWKRTVLAPSMGVFDASAREFCTVRDVRTNTPLQALNLMNDVTYVEAARMLAARMLTEGGAGPAARLAWAFRTLISRNPDARELQVLTTSLQSQLAHFRQRPAEAEKLLQLGVRRHDPQHEAAELAAYAMTASLILNLDEAISKQ
ncbi:MAG: DUF1553 domain-containing protein [Blastocatellia bacterium]